MADVILQPDGGVEVQVVGGLVQKEDLSVHQDEAGQVDPGLFPAGEVGERLGPEGLVDAQAGADLLQAGLYLVPAAGLEGGLEAVIPGQQVRVAGGQLGGEGLHLPLHLLQVVEGGAQHVLHSVPSGVDGDLGDEPQALARGQGNGAAVGLLLAGEDAEEGGLPRSVLPQDAHPLPGVHLEGEAGEHRLAHLVFFL